MSAGKKNLKVKRPSRWTFSDYSDLNPGSEFSGFRAIFD